MEHSTHIINYKKNLLDALKLLNSLSDEVLTLLIVDDNDVMIGTITDGDIRRALIKGASLEACLEGICKKDFIFFQGNVDVKQLHHFKGRDVMLIPVLNKDRKILEILLLKDRYSILPIDAILMAGGKGERLRPLTQSTPKPLLNIGGKPIIDYNVERLIKFGIKNISVTVNYLKEQIEEHFTKPFMNVKINCIREPEFYGTMGAVKYVKNIYNDTVLLMNSDLFTNINYEDFYLHFKDSNADMSVAAVPYTIKVPFGVFDVVGHDINAVIEKPVFNYFTNGGIYLFKKEFIKYIPDGTIFNATDMIERMIEMGHSVIRYPLTGMWIDIGNKEDYDRVQDFARYIDFR